MRIDCADISLVRFVIGLSSAAIALWTIAATTFESGPMGRSA